ncbi:MAG: carbohydrate ABC transporter permease [Oscillospiraceae bacterium]
MIRYKTWENRIVDAVVFVLLILIGLVCLMPLLHVVALSFSDKAAALAGKVGLLPVNPSLAAYDYLLADSRFFTSFGVSVLRVLLGGSINMVLTVLMAFPLSMEKEEFPARNRYMWLVVFTMLFNAGIVPWYFVVKYTGIMDSIWALVLPGAVPVFNVILVMNYFRGLPKEIKEQASIDGISAFGLLVKIYLPLSLPVLATVALFSIVNHWNSFFDGMLLINTPAKVPLQTYIQSLVVHISDMSQSTMTAEQLTDRMSQRTFNAAKIVVSTIPILVIYPFIQRYFVTGITLGSVKG